MKRTDEIPTTVNFIVALLKQSQHKNKNENKFIRNAAEIYTIVALKYTEKQ